MKTCYSSKINKQYGTTIPPWASKENVKESVPEALLKKYDPSTKLQEIIPKISETTTTIQKKSDKRIRGYSIGHRSQRMIQWTFYQKKKLMIIIKIMD